MLFRLFAAFGAFLIGAGTASAQTEPAPNLVDPAHFRVCADPAAMPFSNEKGEGFENKIAELIAKDLGLPLVYTWFPMATGFVRNTLNAGKCDVIMGYGQGAEMVQSTNHYYRSSSVLIFKPGNGLDGIINLDDPRLQDKRIGIIAGTPAADILVANHLMGKAKPYSFVVDSRFESPGQQMVKDIVSGEIDAGILWGPIGGYYAKQANTHPPLTVVPLVKETKGPRQAYRITFGVRPHDQDWKRKLNQLIAKNQDKINQILLAYGVPLLDENDQLITH